LAQYKHNFYGSSYYGETNAFSGTYTTKQIRTDEPLKNTFTVNINALMPHAFYGANDPDIEQVSGTWQYDAAFAKLTTNTPSAELRFKVTSDKIAIRYEQRSTGASDVKVEVTSNVIGGADNVTTYTFSTNSTSINTNAEFVIDNLDYTMHTVRIYLPSTHVTTQYFNFKGIDARVTHFTIETRAYGAAAGWSDWERISLEDTLLDNATDKYKISGVSPNYLQNTIIQVRVWLASSDNEVSPELLDLETIAGDSNNRTEDGVWYGTFDMQAIATADGKTFASVETINWSGAEPNGTTLTIRSSSSPNKTAFGPRSVPYKKGVNRVRLKEGKSAGWVDAPYIRPFYNNEHTFTVEWRTWNDQSFLPPNTTQTAIEYYFLDTNRKESEALHAERTPTRSNRGMLTPIGNKDFFLRIKLRRDNVLSASPVVDYVDVKSLMEYNQPQSVEHIEFSAIDNNNTGANTVFNLSSLSWGNPTEADNLEYRLEDNTKRPQDVMLYFNSEKDKGINRRPVTKLANDLVWAETKDRVPKHYQYGGGAVKYPNVEKIEMAPAFTPSLKSIPYRYFLLSGWPTEYHTVQRGDTLLTISQDYGVTEADLITVNPKPKLNNDGTLMENQRIQLPNNSINSNVTLTWDKSMLGMVTNKSSHNALLSGNADKSSDLINATVSRESTMGEVEWTSEERIYSGICNLNDIRSEYRRVHTAVDSSQSFEVEYTVLNGETYTSVATKFAIYEADLRKRNSAKDEDQLTTGQKIIIPAKFSLPAIDAKAIVPENPYKIEVVYNSVKTKDGRRIDEEHVYQVGNLIIEYTTEPKVSTITRGPVKNGKDPLLHARVVSIDSVYDSTGFRWTPGVKGPTGTWTGDYIQDGNYIDWNVTGSQYEPEAGEMYEVEYTVEVPNKVTIIMDTNYVEEGGIDHIWRSPEVKEFKGVCYPGKDMRVELPPISEWMGTDDNNIEDIEYLIEDNDLWVKTWIEYNENTDKYYAIGSLQDRVPKDNWFPTIQTGYYYLSQDEYYLFNEPIIMEPTDREMPVARNVRYVPGKYSNAAKLQEGSTNFVKNSGFDIPSTNKTVYKLTF
jgi:LysM repeat protein